MQSHIGIRIDAIARDLESRNRYHRKQVYHTPAVHKPHVMTMDEFKKRFWADRKAAAEKEKEKKLGIEEENV